MKLLQDKIRHLLPFLDVTVPHQRHPGRAQVGELKEGGDVSGLDLNRGQMKERDLPRLHLYHPMMEGASLARVDLSEATFHGGNLRKLSLEGCTLTDVHLSLVDAEGLTARDCDLSRSQWSGVALREGRLTAVDLAEVHLSLCDLFGTHLEDVDAHGATFSGVDLSWCSLLRVNLRGADLRGCNLSYADLREVDLSGALLQDTNLCGARGLTDDQVEYARAAGAHLHADALEGLLERGFRRWGWNLEVAARRARYTSLILQAAVIISIFGLTALIFYQRAGREEVAIPSMSTHPGELREPSAAEIAQTKEGLAQLRLAITTAYEVMGRYGTARYPRLEEVLANEYDRDGIGPGTEKVPLVEDGLPANLLTSGEGILPYCNSEARQETLSGDDSDWHYCEDTGRIYACGGFTPLPTLTW